MQSRWSDKQQLALSLRGSGKSIRDIEKKLGVPKSTLSGWFKSVHLSTKLKQQLFKKWMRSLAEARKKAAIRNRLEKERRINEAIEEARVIVEAIDINQSNILELALAILYLGEGTKNS